MEEKESCGLCFNKLPKHMWELLIFTKLGLRDLSRCGAVCQSWRSMAAETQNRLHPFPWLMISRDKETQIGTFFSLTENKIYHLKLTSLASESYCCGGSSQGYLIMVNKKSNFLFNPFSQIGIDLPRQYIPLKDVATAASLFDYRYYFKKAILSSTSMGTSKFLVGALCSNSHIIEMCSSTSHQADWSVSGVDVEDDKKSTPVQTEEGILIEEIVLDVYGDNELFSDILFCKGMLYGLTRESGLVIFDFQDSNPLAYRVLNVMPMEKPRDHSADKITAYLVESCGELLMVYRYRYTIWNDNITKFITIKFMVFKLDQSSDPFQWVQVKSLDDQMLFLGRNNSLSISAKGLPRFKGNCIYFSDDFSACVYWRGLNPRRVYSDNGVFYLGDGHIETLLPPSESRCFKSEPVWVKPNNILESQPHTF